MWNTTSGGRESHDAEVFFKRELGRIMRHDHVWVKRETHHEKPHKSERK